MERKIITTSDGSHSLYIPELDENYHSVHGAIQESKHVFIEAGLKKLLASSESSVFNILEVGLGTGLNALLTYIETKDLNLLINYTSIEAFPITYELAEKLNYTDLLSKNDTTLIENFRKIHESEWEKDVELSPTFILKKVRSTLQKIKLQATFYDLIYFDAFGPPTQPEMWTEEIFTKLHSCLHPGGSIVTYCAKGEVKRTLKRTGFNVESLPGPPGKREMIRAVKV
jgi:tRNA U34 5-methylaminomethyl-2-thiouridine-forming methyltransferase MnmC